MNKKLIIGLMVVSLSVNSWAKDANKLSSVRKFGIKATSPMMMGVSGSDIIAKGEVSIRYRHWMWTRSWSGGSYAKMTVKRGSKRYYAKTLCIEQGDVTHYGNHIIHHKQVCKKNTNYIYMSISKYQGIVAVNFTVEGSTKARLSRIVYNNWTE
jgi:hypothetical protein